MKKILHIVGALERGGIQSNLMNYYRSIDTAKVQFDIIVHKKVIGFEDEFKSLGGNIFYIPTIKEIGIFGYIKKIQDVIRNNGPYHGVHSHLMYQTGFVLLAAKREKVTIRISHAHTSSINSKLFKFTMPLWKFFIRKTATKLIACSQEAGHFMYSKANFKILPNAINYKDFKNIDYEKLVRLKSILNISDDNIVLGHIGRFVDVKNHIYLVEILKRLVERNKKVTLLLVGNGPLLDKIKAVIKSEHLSDNVIFMGTVEDVNVVLKLFDVFLFPSFFEGFGIVVLEAQAMGLKCIVSNTITRSVDLGLGLVDFVPLESMEKWIDLIDKTDFCKKLSAETIDQHMKTSYYNSINARNLLYKLYGV